MEEAQGERGERGEGRMKALLEMSQEKSIWKKNRTHQLWRKISTQENIVNAMRIGNYEDSKEESNGSASGGDESWNSDESDELDVSDGSDIASDESDEEEVIATVFEMFDHEDDEDDSIIDYYEKLFNSD